MPAPAITVAIPTYNGARHLREALRSVLAQDVPLDLIVVDDRSDDETLAIAREIGGDRVRIEQNSERLGLAGNWNRCVALATTPQVAIFHQDDVMLAGHLATHLAAYQANPDLGWVASMAEVIDDAGHTVPESVVERGGLGLVDQDWGNSEDDAFLNGAGLPQLTVTNPLRCSAVTINCALHAGIGGFSQSYRYVVDWQHWICIAAFGPVAWRARTTVAIRWHSASETHRFATGTADLDETAWLLRWLSDRLDQGFAREHQWHQQAYGRLARAYLNRAYTAAKIGQPSLIRRALGQAFRLAPANSVRHLALDPRLIGRLGLGLLGMGRNRSPDNPVEPSRPIR